MEQNTASKLPFRPQDGAVALLSIAALLLSLLLYRHLALGLTFSAGIISIYLQLTWGDTSDATVLTVLWAVFAYVVYTAMLPVILLTAIICLLSYAVWRKSREN